MLFKPWVQSSFWIQQPEFHENVINSPMPCLISMIIAILIPYILFQTMVYFFSKIFVETQEEVSIFTLLHTINIFLLLLPQFFHKTFVGGLVFGDDFLVLIQDGVIWGGGLTTGMVSDEGDLEKMTTKAKMPPYVLQHN